MVSQKPQILSFKLIQRQKFPAPAKPHYFIMLLCSSNNAINRVELQKGHFNLITLYKSASSITEYLS